MTAQQRACANCDDGTGLNPHGAPTRDRLCHACDLAKRIEAEWKTTRSRCQTALERVSYDVASRAGGSWPDGFEPQRLQDALTAALRELSRYEAVVQ